MLVWGERVENTELLTLREAAAAARMSVSKFYRVVHGKAPDVPQLPLVRVGRRAMVQKETFEKWLREVEAWQNAVVPNVSEE